VRQADGMRVFRIAVPVTKIDVARVFYEQVLGIEVDATVPSRLYLHCGDVIVALIDWSTEGRGDFRPNPEHLYFSTEELDAVRARAIGAGAQQVSTIEVQPWGERSFYCTNPDGNHLCFVDDTTLFLGRGAAWA
jgi:predicted enzyme related to lactoylglutathione lyase